MPELDLKYIGSRNMFTTSEMLISDVCKECNNEKLSILDTYFCSLYDKYFKYYHEEKKSFEFSYDYDLLIRSFLKITYNSSRTKERNNNFFSKFRNYILNGNEVWESIIIKLDIITPSIINEKKIYPKSARCGVLDVQMNTNNFLVRAISVNSFYFYILFSKNENIPQNLFSEFLEIESRIPGTIIHPYRDKVIIDNFSTDDMYKLHIDFVMKSLDALNHFNKKNK